MLKNIFRGHKGIDGNEMAGEVSYRPASNGMLSFGEPALSNSSSGESEIVTLNQIPKLKRSKSGRLIDRDEIERLANSGGSDDSDSFSPTLSRSRSFCSTISKPIFPGLCKKRSVTFVLPDKKKEKEAAMKAAEMETGTESESESSDNSEKQPENKMNETNNDSRQSIPDLQENDKNEIQLGLKSLKNRFGLTVSCSFRSSRDVYSILTRIGEEMTAKFQATSEENSCAMSKMKEHFEGLLINESYDKMEHEQMEEEITNAFKLIQEYDHIDKKDYDLCVYIDDILTQRNRLKRRNEELEEKSIPSCSLSGEENNMIISTLKAGLDATILERDTFQTQLNEVNMEVQEKVALIQEQAIKSSMLESTNTALKSDLTQLRQVMHQTQESYDQYQRSNDDAKQKVEYLESVVASSNLKLTKLTELVMQVKHKFNQAKDIIQYGFENCDNLISKDKEQIECLEQTIKTLELLLEQTKHFSNLQTARISHLEDVVHNADTIFLHPNELQQLQDMMQEITAGYDSKEKLYEECNQFLRQSFETSIQDRELLMKDQRLLHIKNSELVKEVEAITNTLSKLILDKTQISLSHDAYSRSNEILLLAILSFTKDTFGCLAPILRQDAISHFTKLHHWLQAKCLFTANDKHLLEKLCKYIVKVENEVFLEYSNNEEIMIGIISGGNERFKEVDMNRNKKGKS